MRLLASRRRLSRSQKCSVRRDKNRDSGRRRAGPEQQQIRQQSAGSSARAAATRAALAPFSLWQGARTFYRFPFISIHHTHTHTYTTDLRLFFLRIFFVLFFTLSRANFQLFFFVVFALCLCWCVCWAMLACCGCSTSVRVYGAHIRKYAIRL